MPLDTGMGWRLTARCRAKRPRPDRVRYVRMLIAHVFALAVPGAFDVGSLLICCWLHAGTAWNRPRIVPDAPDPVASPR
jgi:hypothetical protein